MNIGFNCIATDPGYKGGVNSYTAGLLGGLILADGEHSLQLYVTENNVDFFASFSRSPRVETIVFPVSNIRNRLSERSVNYGKVLHRMISDVLFHSYSKTMCERSDIIYIPTTVLFPYKYSKPTMLSMHDIQQFHYPEFFSPQQLIDRKVRFTLSAELTTYVQASSQFIKEDLLAHYSCLGSEQIVVIPEGVDIEVLSTPVETDLASTYGIPERFLFYPAQLWLHKNHLTLLRALEHLKCEHGMIIPLVLTGAEYSGAEAIFKYISEHNLKNVHYLGVVPFQDIIALYHKARFLITAVLYESSSIPILEAAAAGCPIIASDTPPNREMARILACELFDPLDDRKLAELLLRIWDDDALVARNTSHNRNAIGYYGWDRVAQRYLDFLDTRIVQ